MKNCYCLLLQLSDLVNIRSIRAAGDQAAEGRCQVFKWGGKSTLHWYSCCNNCKSDNSSYTPSCDGETYQSASSTSYCNKCGVDKGTGNATTFQNEFRCGDCDGQNQKRAFCVAKLRGIYKIPGFCWAHARCFKYHCQRSYNRQKRELKDLPDNCFNLNCDSGETSENCAVDCCYKKNPSACSWKINECVDKCCEEPSCCLSSTGNMRQLDIYFGIGLLLIIVLAL